MFASERYEAIKQQLSDKGAVSVSDLMSRFGVSIETVRRDLLYMERQGELKRVHGGAVLGASMKEFKQVTLRKQDFYEEKRELSDCGTALIRDGDIISIDSGSTAAAFARAVKGRFKNLTIITHSLEVFRELETQENYRLILVGGEYLASENAFYGELALQAINNLHIEKAFLCPSGVSLEGGIEDFITELVPVQKAFIKNANKTIILADSSKLERTALMKLCDMDNCFAVVTDSRLDNGLLERYHQHNINIVCGKGSGNE